MGTTFSSSSTKNTKNKKNISEPIVEISKEVSFLTNPVKDEWKQSPRNSDEFYNFTKADVNQDGKKIRTRKETAENKNKRNRSITQYYETKRHTDLIDYSKPIKKRRLGLDDEMTTQIGGGRQKKKTRKSKTHTKTKTYKNTNVRRTKTKRR